MKQLNNQRGIAGIIEVALVVLVLGALGFVGYRAYQARQQKPTTQSETKTTTTKPTSKTDDDALEEIQTSGATFTLTLPVGWKIDTSVPETSFRYCNGGSGYHYSDNKGNFFDVCVDLPGGGFASDFTWETSVSGSGYRIDQEIACTPGGPFCTSGDGKLEIGIKTEANGGHGYFFTAGNSSSESVSKQIFRDILASFRVK